MVIGQSEYDIVGVMMFHDLSSDQRQRLAEKIMDWGNLVFTGLAIAQFVPGVNFNLQTIILVIFGYLSLIAAYSIALKVMKGGDHV